MAALLDFGITLLVALWLKGGIVLNSHLFLKHGADPRRAALILALVVAWRWPNVAAQSRWVQFAQKCRLALRSSIVRRRVGLVVLAWACVLSGVQLFAMRSRLYDVGIFHQILWSLAHGHGFLSTISGAGNFLTDHLAPSLVLFVPFYWLVDSGALALPILQPLLLGGGGAAWVWLAGRLSAKNSDLPAATLVFVLVFDSLWGNLDWGFHETSIAFTTLSWGFALFFEAQLRRRFSARRIVGLLALFTVSALSKEIILLDVAVFALLVAWDYRKRPGVSGALVLGALLLLAVFIRFEQMPHPADKNYFDRYYAYLGHDLQSFARTLLLAPWTVPLTVGVGALLHYAVTVFLPWLGLPFLSSRYLLALAPSLASAALATYAPLRGAFYHYVLGLWPLLAVLTIVALARFTGARQRRWLFAWVVLAALSWSQDPIGNLFESYAGATRSFRALKKMREIPAEASVAADELVGPWLASRAEIYRWPKGGCPEWVVLQGKSMADVTAACGSGYELRWQEGEWQGFARRRS